MTAISWRAFACATLLALAAAPTAAADVIDPPMALPGDADRVHAHASALIPVSARPMISFWICEVPSYSVVTRASRR